MNGAYALIFAVRNPNSNDTWKFFNGRLRQESLNENSVMSLDDARCKIESAHITVLFMLFQQHLITLEHTDRMTNMNDNVLQSIPRRHSGIFTASHVGCAVIRDDIDQPIAAATPGE